MYSLEKKIANRTLIVIAIMMLCIAIIIDQILSKWLIHEFDITLHTKSGVLITLVKDYGNHVEFDFADEFLSEFERDINPEYFQIWNGDGSVFERSRKLHDNDLELFPINENKSQFRNIVLVDGRRGRQIQTTFTPQIPDPELRTPENLAKQQPMTLSTSREIESLHDLQMLVRFALLIGWVIITLSTNLLIRQIIRRGLKPIRTLSKAISEVRSHKRDGDVSLPHCPKELLQLQDDFNHMLSRLHSSFEREKAFSANVSHELKTPISELRLLAEVALMTSKDASLAKITENYNDTLDIALHMQTITENMLLLSRYDGVKNTLDDKINVNHLVSDLINTYSKSNSGSEVSWKVYIQADIIIQSSFTELNVILQNLLQNAVEYSAKGSTIYCKWVSDSDNRSGKLIISNCSHDLNQDDIPKLFDRLWRKDKARAPSNHSGLGMSIIEALCLYLNITVTAQLDDDNMLHITLDDILLSRPS